MLVIEQVQSFVRWMDGRTTMVLDMICDLCYLAYLILELKMSFMQAAQ